MVLLQHACAFFFEIPRIEELQDSNSSPRRGEVGRHVLVLVRVPVVPVPMLALPQARLEGR